MKRRTLAGPGIWSNVIDYSALNDNVAVTCLLRPRVNIVAIRSCSCLALHSECLPWPAPRLCPAGGSRAAGQRVPHVPPSWALPENARDKPRAPQGVISPFGIWLTLRQGLLAPSLWIRAPIPQTRWQPEQQGSCLQGTNSPQVQNWWAGKKEMGRLNTVAFGFEPASNVFLSKVSACFVDVPWPVRLVSVVCATRHWEGLFWGFQTWPPTLTPRRGLLRGCDTPGGLGEAGQCSPGHHPSEGLDCEPHQGWQRPAGWWPGSHGGILVLCSVEKQVWLREQKCWVRALRWAVKWPFRERHPEPNSPGFESSWIQILTVLLAAIDLTSPDSTFLICRMGENRPHTHTPDWGPLSVEKNSVRNGICKALNTTSALRQKWMTLLLSKRYINCTLRREAPQNMLWKFHGNFSPAT